MSKSSDELAEYLVSRGVPIYRTVDGRCFNLDFVEEAKTTNPEMYECFQAAIAKDKTETWMSQLERDVLGTEGE